MREPNSTPSLVPAYDVTVYVVLGHFAYLGEAYRETDQAQAGLEDIIEDLVTGQYNKPARSRFQHRRGLVAGRIGRRRVGSIKRQAIECRILPDSTRSFVEFYVGERTAAKALSTVL